MRPDELHIPPKDVEAEKSVLGSILMDSAFALPIARELLQPESFYSPANGKIIHAMLELDSKDEPIDFITVREVLRKQGELESIGGSAYLNDLVQSVVSSANIEAHAQIVAEKYIQRKKIEILSRALNECYDGTQDVFESTDKTIEGLEKLLSFRKQSKSITDSEQSLQAYLENVERINRGEVSSLATGFNELDNLLGGGFVFGDHVILAGNTGTGKSSMALQMTLNISRYIPTGYFSLEMSNPRMMARSIAQLARITIGKARNPNSLFDSKEEATRYQTAVQDYRKRKMFLDCTPDLTINELCLRIEKLVTDQGMKLAVVDHIGKLASDPKEKFQNREREIAHFSWKVTQLAVKYEIVIVTISPLNKEAESFTMPGLGHMRDSGMLAYDARTVLMLSNPMPDSTFGSDGEQKAKLTIEKQGDGESGVSIELPFHGDKGAYFGDGPALCEPNQTNDRNGRQTKQFPESIERVDEPNTLPI